MITLLIVLFIIVAVLLILIILLQSSKATGMGLFGGSSTDTVLGSGGMDVLTKITAVLGVIFVVLAFGISYYYSKARTKTDLELDRVIKQQQQEQQQRDQQQQQQPPQTVLPSMNMTSNKK
jgi:preprotein translocase subunit SecG